MGNLTKDKYGRTLHYDAKSTYANVFWIKSANVTYTATCIRPTSEHFWDVSIEWPKGNNTRRQIFHTSSINKSFLSLDSALEFINDCITKRFDAEAEYSEYLLATESLRKKNAEELAAKISKAKTLSEDAVKTVNLFCESHDITKEELLTVIKSVVRDINEEDFAQCFSENKRTIYF